MSEENSMASETTEASAQTTEQAPAQDAAGSPAPSPSPAAGEQAAPEADGFGGLDAEEPEAAPEEEQAAPAEPEKPSALGAPKDGYKFGDKTADGIEYDKKLVGAFGEVAKELDLSQAAADKILAKVTPVMRARQQEQIAELRGKWAHETMADPEVGGSRWAEKKADIRRAYKELVPEGLRRIFKASGLDCHPDVVRMCLRYSQRITPDSFERGTAAGRTVATPQSFYDRSHMNE